MIDNFIDNRFVSVDRLFFYNYLIMSFSLPLKFHFVIILMQNLYRSIFLRWQIRFHKGSLGETNIPASFDNIELVPPTLVAMVGVPIYCASHILLALFSICEGCKYRVAFCNSFYYILRG